MKCYMLFSVQNEKTIKIQVKFLTVLDSKICDFKGFWISNHFFYIIYKIEWPNIWLNTLMKLVTVLALNKICCEERRKSSK